MKLILGMSIALFAYFQPALNVRINPASEPAGILPRSTPEAEHVDPEGIRNYMAAVEESGQAIHSLMIVRHGKVIAEHYFGEDTADKPHVMHSVSKTFTATAIGFAIQEGLLKVSDHVISFFPDQLPAKVPPNLRKLTIEHLLTMSVGHDTDPTDSIRSQDADWATLFLAYPIPHKPGTTFVYNSVASYMLSAIVQKVTGQKVMDYLKPRLFDKLGIEDVTWETSPTGVNCGGWGLYLTTEDMAKMGQFMLQKGEWEGEQLLSATWFDKATKAHIKQPPVWFDTKNDPAQSDWVQGYGYQCWRSRHNSFRADGAFGQFILVWPEQDAVVVTTANIQDMQSEINLIWDNIFPAMK